jgi:hypothetical protein
MREEIKKKERGDETEMRELLTGLLSMKEKKNIQSFFSNSTTKSRRESNVSLRETQLNSESN